MLVAAILGGGGAGCKRSEPVQNSQPTPRGAQAAAQRIGRFHWLGKNQLAKEANAAAINQIWNQPVSSRLEREILDKLSTAPRRLLLRESGTNAADGLLRPLLGDLVHEEWYLEVRQCTNGPGELTLAIQLSEPRAQLWKANLAGALEALTHLRATPSSDSKGWSLKKHHPPNLCELRRAGKWTLFGLATDSNPSMTQLLAFIQQHGIPFERKPTNSWLELEADLPALSRAFPRAFNTPADFPSVALTVNGDGQNVRTHGTLQFPKDLGLQLEPWKLPTNTIREPLISFTVARGVAPICRKLEALANIKTDLAPNQVCAWALSRVPFQTFVSLPVADATNFLRRIGPPLIGAVNPKLPENSGRIIVASNGVSLVWTGVPFATPYMLPIVDSGQHFVLGGLFPNTLRTNPLPSELLHQFIAKPDLVYYDWEITQERVMQFRYVDDLSHIVLGTSHKPLVTTNLASIAFLGNVATKLGNSVTEGTFSTNTLRLVRKSSIGFTGAELELLANWVESPQFPAISWPASSRMARNAPGANSEAIFK